jgi:hypothetical protein
MKTKAKGIDADPTESEEWGVYKKGGMSAVKKMRKVATLRDEQLRLRLKEDHGMAIEESTCSGEDILASRIKSEDDNGEDLTTEHLERT